MLETFFIVLSFAAGRLLGIEQSKKVADTSNTDELEAQLLDAELRAETWKRRYNNLLPTTQTSFEE
jgi:hypothetical protein